ncbi:amino acid permease [Staphylococcus succinus]|uniref:amino acid permease n=1 Tax=Staphylococcus succinus TaxID=61015 RepID=UPI002DBFB2A8|nr:amino acid permease [Staphylococcus succinus]MEB8123672.1 amino acid permease [Staphylococcus succinus]
MKTELKRELTSRQIQMIALGGTIGVGLFMGASSTIKWTGPSVILSYLIAGVFVFLIMRALGEMVYTYPDTGSFAKFASDYIHPSIGYITASSSIFNWIVVGMSEVIAVGSYMKFWWPDLPGWVPGLIVVLLLLTANLVSVKWFGEFEFWFALIKVITIILMIIAGLGIVFFGIGNGFHPIGLSNLWSHGGFFTNGFTGFFFSLSIIFGSYIGIELIGTTAGEAKNPQKTVVKSINGVIWRILIFYIGSIFIIVTVYPWNAISELGSPFVATFTKVGITSAATIINFVVITAAMSGCNSGIFSTSRMLYTLSKQNHAPKIFQKTNANGVPYYSVIAVCVGILGGVLLNILLPLILGKGTNIFVYVFSAGVFPGMVPWFAILISHLYFRKKEKIKNHPFKMPFAPYSNIITFIMLIAVVIGMIFNSETRISVIIGIAFVAFNTLYILISTKMSSKNKNDAEVFTENLE